MKLVSRSWFFLFFFILAGERAKWKLGSKEGGHWGLILGISLLIHSPFTFRI